MRVFESHQPSQEYQDFQEIEGLIFLLNICILVQTVSIIIEPLKLAVINDKLTKEQAKFIEKEFCKE